MGVIGMTRNPEKVAWTVLWLAFFAFCFLAAAIPWSISAYMASATDAQQVSLEVLRGTVLLQEKGTKFEINAEGKRSSQDSKAIILGEGDSLRTVENSQAILWLFDGSNVQLWPNTSISLEELKRTRYNDNESELVLLQKNGHSRFEVAPSITKSRRLEVKTPDANVQLFEGSFSVDRSETASDVVVHSGKANVRTMVGAVELLKKERAQVQAGSKPTGPLPASRNLIRNGSFTNSLSGWQVANRGEEEPILGAASAETADGRNALRFSRVGATRHAETYIFQPLNQDITDFESLKLGIDFRLINQSLAGGGIAGSEYPAMVRLKYKDIYGSETIFVRGFYYRNENGYPTHDGQLAAHEQWQSFELDILGSDTRLQLRPAYLLWLEVAASGHNYESLVTNIRLIAE